MQTPKVLIVDDDAILLKLIGSYLSRAGVAFEPVFADSVKQAKTILRGNDIAVMVTDLLLPDGDGIELLAFAQRQYPRITNIIQSAHVAGMEGILTDHSLEILAKPFRPKDLLESIENALARDIPAKLRLADFLLMVEFLELTCQMKIGQDEQPKGSILLYRGKMADAFHDDQTGLDAALALTGLSNAWVDIQGFQFKVPPTRKIDLDISEILLAQTQRSANAVDIDPAKPLDLDEDGPEINAESQSGTLTKSVFHAQAEDLCNQVAKGMRSTDGYQNMALFGDVAQLIGFWSFDQSADDKKSVMQLMQTLTDFSHSMNKLGFGHGNQILYHAEDGLLIGTMSPPNLPFKFTLVLKATMGNKIGHYRLKMETLAHDLRQMALGQGKNMEVA